MAEEPTPTVETTEPAETTAADPTPVEQTTTEPSAAPAEPVKADPAPEAPKAEDKPVSRRSAAYRLQQVLQENRELKQQLQPEPEPATQPDDIQAKINAAIAKALTPYQSATTKAADDAELAELVGSNPAAKEYEGKLREMWSKPQYKDLAASDLLKLADYDKLSERVTAQAIEEYKKAEIEAKKSSTGGNSTSNRSGKGKSVADMTPEEFKAHNEAIMAKL